MTMRPNETDFEVEDVDPARSAALLAIHDANTAWTERQLRAGVPFNPDEHPAHSDYNTHTAELEADGAAEDDFHAAAQEALQRSVGGTPLAAPRPPSSEGRARRAFRHS